MNTFDISLLFIFQLIFVAKVAPLGLTTYFISSGLGSKLSEYSSVTVYNPAGSSIKPRYELLKLGIALT